MPRKKPKEKQSNDRGVTPIKSRRGRPKGARKPIVLKVRASHLTETMLAYAKGIVDESSYSSIARTAIAHYITTHPAFSRDEFMALLAEVAKNLRTDDPISLEFFVEDVARTFDLAVPDVTRMLRVSWD